MRPCGMRQIRWSAAMALQAGGRLLLEQQQQQLSGGGGGGEGEGGLAPSTRLAFAAISVGLVIVAGLMSGLTLGLMSMDLVELEVLKRSGTPSEQLYASAIMPVVANQHFLLVTLLLCNAVAMEALPLFLDRLADPVTAILISVTAVLAFGEILPQAVCSRYGLAIGYYCAWLVRGLMALTSPISWPIGKLLDFLLGAEHRALFRRGQLKALVDIHGADEGLGGNLSEDEIKVICGALDLTNKTARKSMTPLNKVFMLPADARLNQATMRAILASGHSRIPVYTAADRSGIVGLILVKELLQYKTHQEVPVSDVRMRSLPRLPADTPMYDMLKLFQTGRSHMVVLTDTPATARAAAAAAATAAAEEAAAAAAEGDSSSDSSRSGGSGSPLGYMLRGAGKGRKQRHPFQSPLLQPLEQQPLEQQQQQQGQAGAAAANGSAAWIAGAPRQQQQQQQQPREPELFPEQEALGIGCGSLQLQQLQQLYLQSKSQRERAGAGAGAPGSPLREQELASGASPRGSFDCGARAANEAAGGGGGGPGRGRLGGRSVQFGAAPGGSGGGDSPHAGAAEPPPQQQQQQLEPPGDPLSPSRRPLSRQRSKGQHGRSMSGPLPASILPMGGGGVAGLLDGSAPEGVAVPIGIITIEDVIEELMQAEIVDETDIYIDNERSITVNAAALAQSLPAQLRLALAPLPARGSAGPAAAAGAAARVTVRKLMKQRSSSSLGLVSAATGGATSSAAAPPPRAPSADASVSSVAAAVSAGLSAAAAAVVGGSSGGAAASGEAARSRGAERQPLLSPAEQAAMSAG